MHNHSRSHKKGINIARMTEKEKIEEEANKINTVTSIKDQRSLVMSFLKRAIDYCIVVLGSMGKGIDPY